MDYTITWNSLPKNLDEMKALPQADLKSPEGTAALTVAALCVYPDNAEECYRMLDFLRGPRPLSNMEKQFIRDRFMDGKNYLARSYFKGATPKNEYKPDEPFKLVFSNSAAQIAEEGYKILNVKSGGADSHVPLPYAISRPPVSGSCGSRCCWQAFVSRKVRMPGHKNM